MEPPALRKKKVSKPTWRVLLTKDTGVEIFLDIEDFNKAKHVLWYENKRSKIIYNRQGVKLIDYLGLANLKLKNETTYDFRKEKTDG